MSKFSSFAEYPPRSLVGAEAELRRAWASLERFHDDLVLVGGLAAGNRGYASAVEALRRHSFETGQSAPLRCAAFALDGQPGIDDRQMRERQIVEQLVTIGRALAGEG